MKKILLFAIMLAIIPATSAVAVYPFDGWGIDCGDWEHYSEAYTSGHLIYDPLLPGYRECPGCDPVDWPDFQLDLWIELEIIVHFDWLQADIHRVSNYAPIVLIMGGWIEQNNGNTIIVWPGSGYNLNWMKFLDDMWGRGPTFGTDIPVTWEYSVEGSPYAPMRVCGDNLEFDVFGICHHDFAMRIIIDPKLHQEDGIYKLAGEICPLPGL